MGENIEDIEILLAKLFAGEATETEVAAITAWRAQHPANERTYEQSRKLMERLSAGEFKPEVDQAWQKVERRIAHEKPSKTIYLFSRQNILRAAAALLVLLGGVWLFNRNNQDAGAEPTLISALNTPVEQKLPDGSTVKVAGHSELKFRKEKNGERIAYLRGEAFFEVVHKEDEPFIVSTGEVFIKDIGTAFNIRTLPGTGNTEVFVESGEVQFYTKNSDGIKLIQGERAVYERQTGVFTKSLIEGVTHINSFRSRSFTFTENRLGDVLNQVNLVYGSHLVTASPELNNCRLSVTFNNEPLEVVVDVIAQTLDLTTKQSGDTLILTGHGCN